MEVVNKIGKKGSVFINIGGHGNENADSVLNKV